jgi:hypothetical protein
MTVPFILAQCGGSATRPKTCLPPFQLARKRGEVARDERQVTSNSV